MKIAILSLSVGQKYQKAVSYGTKSRDEYAIKHGYTFINEIAHLDPTRHPAWSKILLIQKYLKDFDYVFWSDADSVIMDMEVKLEDLIDSQKDIIISCDPFGLNTGEFFVKNTPFSEKLLHEVYYLEKEPKFRAWEQTALKIILKNNPTYWNNIRVEPARLFNSIWPNYFETVPLLILSPNDRCKYKEGHFIVHLCGSGGNLEYLEENMASYYLKRKV